MPVNLPAGLPAVEILTNENIFVMTDHRAKSQDIRPIQLLILNLMPTKVTTETQLLRLLGNTPLQVEPTFLMTSSYAPTHTDKSHLDSFYCTFGEVKGRKFDGMVITGAPVEHLAFEDVAYWDELRAIMDWSVNNVYSTLFICWAAQAALYHFYGVQKYPLEKKMFGVFEHETRGGKHKLTRGFDDYFLAPHSRHTEVRLADIEKIDDIDVLGASAEAGFYLGCARGGRRVFVTGHSEYDRATLDAEYKRDVAAGKQIETPRNYYANNDPKSRPALCWRAHSSLLFGNWLNYGVYQETPYDIERIADSR